MRASLNSKILLVVLVVVMATAVPLGVVFYRAERTEILSAAEERASGLGDIAHHALVAAMMTAAPESVEEITSGIVESDHVVGMAIYDANGAPAFGTGTESLAAEYRDTLRTHGTDGRQIELGGQRIFRVLNPIEIEPACFGCHSDSDPIAGLIQVDLSLEREYEVLGERRYRYLLQTLALTLALVLALWLVLSRAVVRPLKAFARRARLIARGDLSQRVDFRQEDEIGDLAISFNSMTEELEARIGELEEAKDRLETSIHRVAEALSSALDIDSIMRVMISESMGVSGFEDGRVLVQDGSVFGPSPVGGLVVCAGAEVRDTEDIPVDDPLTPVLRGLTFSMAGVDTFRVLYRSADMGLAEAGLPPEYETLVLIPMIAEAEVFGHLLLVSRAHLELDISERRALEFLTTQGARAVVHSRLHDRAREMAITDGLTGLFDHRHFYEQFEMEMHRAGRYGLPLALVLLDVDYFKNYNDRVGHRGGDQVLRRLGALLRESARATDITARYGGEEFAVILPHTSHAEAMAYAERLRRAVQEEPFLEEAGQPGGTLSISIGVASRPEHGGTVESVVEAADGALFRAKAAGRNRVVSADVVTAPRIPEGGFAESDRV
ncbi:MAG: GGDEF domain-containing protein [Thermoleophilia bacterium]